MEIKFLCVINELYTKPVLNFCIIQCPKKVVKNYVAVKARSTFQHEMTGMLHWRPNPAVIPQKVMEALRCNKEYWFHWQVITLLMLPLCRDRPAKLLKCHTSITFGQTKPPIYAGYGTAKSHLAQMYSLWSLKHHKHCTQTES